MERFGFVSILAAAIAVGGMLHCSGSSSSDVGAANDPDAAGQPAPPVTTEAGASPSSIALAPGAHGLFVLFPPPPGSQYSSHLDSTLIQATGAGHHDVKGAAIAVPWKQINPSSGTFDWSSVDASIDPWIKAGFQVALIFQPTNVTENHNSTNTPAWWTTPSNITSIAQTGSSVAITLDASTPATSWAVGSLVGQRIQVRGTGMLDGTYAITANDSPTSIVANAGSTMHDGMSATTGTAGNPVYGKSCTNGMPPVQWDENFMTTWKGVIAAAKTHFDGNSSIAYMRFGGGIGGENFVSSSFNNKDCRAELDAEGYSDTTWTSYLGDLASFIQSQHFAWTIDLALDQNSFQASTCTTKDCGGYGATADVMAKTFAAAGIALGQEGIQDDDVAQFAAGKPCFIGNWCSNFAAHPEVPHQVQGRTAPSDALYAGGGVAGTGVTGSWAKLMPFAVDRGVQIIEVFWADWLCTFDSTWTTGATDHNTYSICTGAGYPAAFDAAAAKIN